MENVIKINAWCPDRIVRRIRQWADGRKIWIDDNIVGKLRIVPDGGEPLEIDRPRALSLVSLGLSVAKATGRDHIDVWRCAEINNGDPWRIEIR